MKIRTGFVSNSSSSSYVCDVTGEAFEVHDSCFWDAGLAQCKSGHVFKKEFLVPWTPEYPSTKVMLAKLDSITDSKRVCESYRALKDHELKAAYAKTMKMDGSTNESSVNECPICTMNRIKDSDLITFLLKQAKLTRGEVECQIRKEFQNNETFQRYISK